MKTMAIGAALAALAGCASPLYDWGSYEDVVWDMHRPGFSAEKQAEALSAEIESTLARGKQVPPGKYATLGLLYYRLGDAGQAACCWEREKELYPECAAFVDGMIRRMP